MVSCPSGYEHSFVFVAQYEAAAVIEHGTIDALEVGYAVRRPIPYKIEMVAAGDYLASFDDANIAVGGRDAQDAYQSLVAEILDTYDVLEVEAEHSPQAQAQFALLQTYIVKT
jgi:hypothetical protein